MTVKKSISWFIVMLCLLICTGCSKKNQIETEAVGPLFVDNFIYNKDKEVFVEQFVDGDMLEKHLTVMMNEVQYHFSSVFDTVVEDISVEEKMDLSNHLMENIHSKTTYEVTTTTNEKGNEIEVVYHVKGLDYGEVVHQTMLGIVEAILNEDIVDPSGEASKEFIIKAFYQALEQTAVSENVVDVPLLFEKIKGQWQLKANQDDNINELLFAFMTGTKDREEYDEEMANMIDRVTTEATDKLK